MKRILVVGIGNLLLGDEGVGVHVVSRLKESALPPGVEAVDVGTNSYDLIDCLYESERLIVIDAMQGGGEPGDHLPGSLRKAATEERGGTAVFTPVAVSRSSRNG